MEGRELEVWKPLLTLWYAFNILAVVGFGFHQAEMMPIARDIGALDNGGVSYVSCQPCVQPHLHGSKVIMIISG